MIPRVKTWTVSVLDDNGKVIERIAVLAPTKLLARLNVRHEYPRTWGHALKIGLKRAGKV